MSSVPNASSNERRATIKSPRIEATPAFRASWSLDCVAGEGLARDGRDRIEILYTAIEPRDVRDADHVREKGISADNPVDRFLVCP